MRARKMRVERLETRLRKKTTLFFTWTRSRFSRPSVDHVEHLECLVENPRLDHPVDRGEMIHGHVFLESRFVVIDLEEEEMGRIAFVDGDVETATAGFLLDGTAGIDQHGFPEFGDMLGFDLEIDGNDVHGDLCSR